MGTPATLCKLLSHTDLHRRSVNLVMEPPPESYETSIPTAEKTAEMRARVAHVEVSPEDVAAGWTSSERLNRFLIARQGDVVSAARMYEETVRFRRETGICRILETYTNPRVMHMCFSGGFTGIDREGFPVSFERIGTADAAGIHAAVLRAAAEETPSAEPPAVALDPFVRWMAWNHEEQERVVLRWCELTGRARGRITFVIDLAGVSMRHLSSAVIAVLRAKATLEMAHYPEIVRRVFLINTPAIVLPVWAAMKVFLDQREGKVVVMAFGML